MRILDGGDTALTIEFGDGIERRWLAAVAALDEALAQAMAEGSLPGVVETVPTLRSLTVIYDPLLTSRVVIEPVIRQALQVDTGSLRRRGKRWQLPVCYGDQLAPAGPDLDHLATACGLTATEVVRLHAATTYEVYMLGFLPGFAFMGNLAPALAQPRRREPRLRVPAGSVAVAGLLTAIYPWDSPGGWHLLGLCPVPLFAAAWAQAALLQAGDQVSFRAVDAVEYRALAAAMDAACRSSQSPHAIFADYGMLDAGSA